MEAKREDKRVCKNIKTYLNKLRIYKELRNTTAHKQICKVKISVKGFVAVLFVAIFGVCLLQANEAFSDKSIEKLAKQCDNGERESCIALRIYYANYPDFFKALEYCEKETKLLYKAKENGTYKVHKG